jgi:ABC-type microcin C transport system permease subunit YejB
MITDQIFSCVHVTSNTQFWNSLGILDRLGLLVYNATYSWHVPVILQHTFLLLMLLLLLLVDKTPRWLVAHDR